MEMTPAVFALMSCQLICQLSLSSLALSDSYDRTHIHTLCFSRFISYKIRLLWRHLNEWKGYRAGGRLSGQTFVCTNCTVICMPQNLINDGGGRKPSHRKRWNVTYGWNGERAAVAMEKIDGNYLQFQNVDIILEQMENMFFHLHLVSVSFQWIWFYSLEYLSYSYFAI